MARLIDFDYVAHDEPRHLPGILATIVGKATFCITGEGGDHEERSADFWDALEEFKESVPGRQRALANNPHVWTVHVTCIST